MVSWSPGKPFLLSQRPCSRNSRTVTTPLPSAKLSRGHTVDTRTPRAIGAETGTRGKLRPSKTASRTPSASRDTPAYPGTLYVVVTPVKGIPSHSEYPDYGKRGGENLSHTGPLLKATRAVNREPSSPARPHLFRQRASRITPTNASRSPPDFVPWFRERISKRTTLPQSRQRQN